MTNPSGEVSKVSTSVIDALRTQPLALALIVINLLFLMTGVYVFNSISAHTTNTEDRRAAIITDMMKSQNAISERLANCVAPAR